MKECDILGGVKIHSDPVLHIIRGSNTPTHRIYAPVSNMGV